MYQEQTKVSRDAYFLLTVKWKGGFTHYVASRGYGLKSQLDFTKSLEYVESVTYAEITEEQYKLKVFGDGSEWESQPVADTKSKNSKTSTTSPRKSGPSVKKVGKKPSATKVSATPVKKTAKKTTKSSTTKKTK